MASRANSKMIRKTTEQLDGRLRVQQLEPAGSSAPRITLRQATYDNPMGYDKETRQRIRDSEAQVQREMNRIREFENKEDSDKEPEYQHDPLTKQQILSLTSNWTFGEGEDLPYDSDEPQIAYGLTPSVDDTSSEEEPEKDNTPERIAHKQVNQHNDEQFIELYGVPNMGPRTHYTPQLRIEDHPYLRITDPSHRYLFWAQCFFDHCETHMGEKYEHYFQPRKYDNTPLRNVYTAYTLTGWELRKFDGNIATFTPSR
ncbi:uncharacterized protein CTRU02_208395 [Colletotrichum truncatum]|uniref:Uncharacterized protein n=1 Tax=Colletotrichum truncatum TaxID=5467 RepID=A0ACC3YW73_COLTU